MGGCLDKPKSKKGKVLPGTLKSPQSNRIPASRISIQQQQVKKKEEVIPKHKKMSINELLTTYRVQCTLELCSKMEGPKYLSNVVDGSSKVLRVVNLEEVNEKRLEVYKRILGLETYENEEGAIMILDEYCAGEDLYELVEALKAEDQNYKRILLAFFEQVVKIVTEFHKNRTWLGNLNFSSFKKKSAFSDEVRLVDINLYNQVGEYQKVGFAHKESFEADYQFLGYLLQFIICDQSPIFIPHKIQYVEFQSIPFSALVQKLLKGNSLSQDELSSIKAQNVVLNKKVLWGYKFRRDINKLLKMRKKRKAHYKGFYGQDIKEMANEHRFQEEAVYRFETERIMQRIKGYINELKSSHQEPFINYAGNNDSLRKMKEVFLLTDKDKKLAELRDCLSTIK